jgi:Asp-tRNA(Asn)/Glu-tRNA(Gln) amidotransferase A subunit family amidase
MPTSMRPQPPGAWGSSRYSGHGPAALLLAAVRTGELAAQDAADAAIERAWHHRELNAFISLAGKVRVPVERAEPSARAGRLAGLPIAVKDNIHAAGFRCTAGTRGLREWQPQTEASVVRRLRAEGAVVIGKTNLHELAVGITSNNPTFGAVRNPYDPSLIAGGSSGGSAVAVATGVVPAALGTDTAGSCRIPASLCGCVGFRPTVGRYPPDGVVPVSATRDTIGILAREAGDVMLLDEVATGMPTASSGLAGRRLGVPGPYFYDDLDDEVRPVIDDALARLDDAGAVLVQTEVKKLEQLTSAISLPLTFFEWPRDLGRYLNVHRCRLHLWEVAEEIAGEVERGWLEAELSPGAVHHDAYLEIIEHGRPSLIAAYRKCFETDRLDALVVPTTRLPARPVGHDDVVIINGREVPTLDAYLRNTDPSSVAGLPGISVPAGLTASGLPVGLSFDGLAGDDATILALGEAFQQLGPALAPPGPL